MTAFCAALNIKKKNYIPNPHSGLQILVYNISV